MKSTWNEQRLMPVSARLEGEYGIRGVFAGVPAVLGTRGVESIIELKLSSDELAALRRSAEDVRKVAAGIA